MARFRAFWPVQFRSVSSSQPFIHFFILFCSISVKQRLTGRCQQKLWHGSCSKRAAAFRHLKRLILVFTGTAAFLRIESSALGGQ